MPTDRTPFQNLVQWCDRGLMPGYRQWTEAITSFGVEDLEELSPESRENFARCLNSFFRDGGDAPEHPEKINELRQWLRSRD